MPPKLGILAGRGHLPEYVVDVCRDGGRPYFVVAFKGQTSPETVADSPHVWVRMGAAGAAIRHLRGARVEDLVMAGVIRRPSFASLRPDMWAARFFVRTGAAALGDDGLLSCLVRALEGEGFRLVGVDSLLPHLLASEGVYGRVRPDRRALRDVERGFEAARRVGALDTGQAAVVRDGCVVAVENEHGTDALLRKAAATRSSDAPNGVLVKAKKPGQEVRADLPTIGPVTVREAAQARLAGIVVEAGASLVIDRADVIAAADSGGLFVMGVAQPGDRAG